MGRWSLHFDFCSGCLPDRRETGQIADYTNSKTSKSHAVVRLFFDYNLTLNKLENMSKNTNPPTMGGAGKSALTKARHRLPADHGMLISRQT